MCPAFRVFLWNLKSSMEKVTKMRNLQKLDSNTPRKLARQEKVSSEISDETHAYRDFCKFF